MKKKNEPAKPELYDELHEFLLRFEGAPKQLPQDQNPEDADIWNELHVPVFRNLKVFLHQSADELIIVIPTHVSASEDVFYHVIREDMTSKKHNGEHEILSAAEFRAKYKCNFIPSMNVPTTSAKITDLAKEFVNRLGAIKKLKSKTEEEQYDSTMYFARVILNFLMQNNNEF